MRLSHLGCPQPAEADIRPLDGNSRFDPLLKSSPPLTASPDSQHSDSFWNACASRECLLDQRCNLVTQQLDRAHDMPVLHAEPLDTSDQPIAACSPHQMRNICGAFLGRADNEAVVDEVLELGVCFRVTDDSSEKAPIAKDPVAFSNGRSDIADRRLPIRRNDDIPQYRKISWSRLPLLGKGRLEHSCLLGNDVVLQM